MARDSQVEYDLRAAPPGMKPWLRLAIITLTVGGGFAGFATALQGVITGNAQPQPHLMLAGGFAVLYAFVLTSGLLFAHDQGRTIPLMAAFALQVPWLSTPFVAYQFTAGLHITVGFVGARLFCSYNIGTEMQCNVLQDLPFGAGINIVALAILILLACSFQRRNEAEAYRGQSRLL
jgi:hypothetical protein